MCSIIGAVLRPTHTQRQVMQVNQILASLWEQSHKRGRDGRGFTFNSDSSQTHRQVSKSEWGDECVPSFVGSSMHTTFVANLRAEPTTEYVNEKQLDDQQPYLQGKWAVVHNGTIANDKQLRTGHLRTSIDSAAIVEQLAPQRPDLAGFLSVIHRLKGSYAILASHYDRTGVMFVAANYRPVWYTVTPHGVFFFSSREFFVGNYPCQMLPPYTAAVFDAQGILEKESLYTTPERSEKALVVCSGGLDSVVAATYAKKKMGMGLHLIHFLYGSRAEGPEVDAVTKVADYLGAELTLFPLNVYSKSDSPLLDPDSKVAGGEEGAEFAHEWVPARNLVLLSVATAFAEARGISTIILGNNLEEAGAYPDNEPEFIDRFNDLLSFAVGDGKRMRVQMPVGNMMKHEIVKLGLELDAPLHLTWSCYRAGEIHCGKCGPCYMRRKAFGINNADEVIQYKE